MLQNGYINAPKTWILPSSTACAVPASHQPVHASESPFYHPGIFAEFGWEKSEKNQWGLSENVRCLISLIVYSTKFIDVF